jgi:hypothetical protein
MIRVPVLVAVINENKINPDCSSYTVDSSKLETHIEYVSKGDCTFRIHLPSRGIIALSAGMMIPVSNSN